jgi:diacylglycerol kinase (ATP)
MDEPRPDCAVQIVSNPLAGSFSKARFTALCEAFERAGYAVHLSESSARSPFIHKAGIDLICVAGGDGTVRHVAAALAPLAEPPHLTVYPMGTINLVAREWNVPKEPEAFVRSLGTQPVLRPVEINDTYFIACASVGPDARAVAAVSEPLKRWIGRAAYAVSMTKEFIAWSRPHLTLSIEGRHLDCEAVYVAKGRYFAGPWSFAPNARVDQPDLHIVALKTARRRDFLRFMIATLFGSTKPHPNIIRRTCTTFWIGGSRTLAVQADGDIITHLPAELTVI